MILGALIASAAVISATDNPITLERVFAKGEKGTYKVASSLQIETRQMGSDTFMPEDLDINYDFTYEVTEVKGDGIAVLRYKRPSMVEITGETYNSPPKSKVVKSNF